VADLDTTKLHATDAELMEMGPIDYAVLEWGSDRVPTGAAAQIVSLVDRGLIRILDAAFIAKEDDGIVTAVDLGSLEAFGQFQGASSGLLDQGDLEAAGEVLEPGSMAAVLIWENRWLAPVAVALRESGAQLVANGRIPVQAIIAALEAAETDDTDD
jgi:Family of unknown function (DUF6325)